MVVTPVPVSSTTTSSTTTPDLSYDAEDVVIRRAARLLGDLGVAVEVRNEARVHLWCEPRFVGATVPRLVWISADRRRTADGGVCNRYCASAIGCLTQMADIVAGKFEVYQDRAGKFRFRLKASNGQVVATGEAYESKANALKGCESVQRAAEGATIEEVEA